VAKIIIISNGILGMSRHRLKPTIWNKLCITKSPKAEFSINRSSERTEEAGEGVFAREKILDKACQSHKVTKRGGSHAQPRED
jgi:hypothetical protein